MVLLQSVTLRLFVLVTRVRMYMLASIILAYCAIGVFALHNVEFDIWVLLAFGVVGYVMRNLGFPLAPMILGVVLGTIAELNLSRALAIDSDWTLFFTRPWSLFFVILAGFSALFPLYQRMRGAGGAARWFLPALMVALAAPLFMMPGVVRPVLGGGLIVAAAWSLVRSRVRGATPTPSP